MNILHPVLNGLPGNLRRKPVSASHSTRWANSWIPTLSLVDGLSNPARSDGFDRIITPRIRLSPTMPKRSRPDFRWFDIPHRKSLGRRALLLGDGIPNREIRRQR